MRRLLIFVKHPVPGRVKTRLASSIGAPAACEVSRLCAELTLARLGGFRPEAVLCVDPPSALGAVAAWVGPEWRLAPQIGEHLGARLAHATTDAFRQGASQVVVIGTDSPWLRPAEVERAFALLDCADLVLGPAEDGGYYLVGLSAPAPAVFEGVAWGSPQVCAETQANAGRLALRVSLLPPGYDLDHLADVHRFIDAERRRGPVSAAVEAMAAVSERRSACPS